MKTKSIIQHLIIIILIVVFTYPGMNKLLELGKFKEQLSLSPFLSDGLSNLLSWLVPITLLSIAGLLIHKRIQQFILKLYLGLIALFTLYIIAILTLAPFIPCSCIGFSDRFTWQQQLLFNIAVMMLVVVAMVLNKKLQPKMAFENEENRF